MDQKWVRDAELHIFLKSRVSTRYVPLDNIYFFFFGLDLKEFKNM